MYNDQAAQAALAERLVRRLERMPVDSIWARRASGLRGNLLRWLDVYERGGAPDPGRLEGLIEQGYAILSAAARAIRSTGRV